MDFTILELGPNELSGSNVVDYVYLAIAEMIRNNHYPKGQIFHLTDKAAMVALHDTTMLGIIVYSDYMKYDQSYHINLSYTSEPYRRKGVNAALWQRLTQHAREAGALTVTSGILANNTSSIANAQKRGMELHTQQYSYSLYSNKL